MDDDFRPLLQDSSQSNTNINGEIDNENYVPESNFDEYNRNIVRSASEIRLQKLIHERLKPGVDKEKIDQRIWDLFGEDWCVMFTDLSGFSRYVAEFGIIHFLQTIYESHRLLIPIIENNDGILLKIEGDSFLVIFRNVDKAVRASVQMQNLLKKYNTDKPDEEKVLLCIGLGYGKILKIGDTDVFGSEVNLASKLGEDTAKAWEILLTKSVKDKLKNEYFQFEEIEEVFQEAGNCYKLIYS